MSRYTFYDEHGQLYTCQGTPDVDPRTGARRGRRPKEENLAIRDVAIKIVAEWPSPRPLRHLFYRLLSTGALDVLRDADGKLDGDEAYSKVVSIVTRARWDGLIPMEMIIDELRDPVSSISWAGLGDFAPSAAVIYRRDKWEDQSSYVEVWVEKNAIVPILRDVCRKYQVTLRPFHGFNSLAAIHQTAQELLPISKNITIFYLGDHDPHGYAIEKDMHDRMRCMFDFLGRPQRFASVDFPDRLGAGLDDLNNPEFADIFSHPLTVDEIGGKGGEKWREKRAEFIERFDNRACEVDALPPDELISRVERALQSRIDDQAAWDAAGEIELVEKADIEKRLSGPDQAISEEE